MRGFHQGRRRSLSLTNRPDICEQARFSIIKSGRSCAGAGSIYVRALRFLSGRDDQALLAVWKTSGRDGLVTPGLTQFVEMLKIQGGMRSDRKPLKQRDFHCKVWLLIIPDLRSFFSYVAFFDQFDGSMPRACTRPDGVTSVLHE